MAEVKERAALFKALGDENRLKLLELLKDGSKNATQLLEEMDVVQSTLSHHLSVLAKCALIHTRKDGKWTIYTLSPSGFARAATILGEMSAALSLPEQVEESAPAQPRPAKKQKTTKPPAANTDAPASPPREMDAWLL